MYISNSTTIKIWEHTPVISHSDHLWSTLDTSVPTPLHSLLSYLGLTSVSTSDLRLTFFSMSDLGLTSFSTSDLQYIAFLYLCIYILLIVSFSSCSIPCPPWLMYILSSTFPDLQALSSLTSDPLLLFSLLLMCFSLSFLSSVPTSDPNS